MLGSSRQGGAGTVGGPNARLSPPAHYRTTATAVTDIRAGLADSDCSRAEVRAAPSRVYRVRCSAVAAFEGRCPLGPADDLLDDWDLLALTP
jgi:hypothetical protein